MRLLLFICFFAILLAHPNSGFAQKEVEISGIKYILHTVSKSETVFSLSQKYKVTPKEIQDANPGLNAILKNGSIVKIPVGKVEQEPKIQEKTAKKNTEEEFYYHKVEKNQTLYSIERQYQISEMELIRYNPELSNGLKLGQVLKIPVSVNKPDNQSINNPSVNTENQIDNSKYSVHQVVSGETLYSLEQEFGILHQEMLKLNPELQNGLKAGMKLRVPAKSLAQPEEPEVDPRTYFKYQVEKGETLFSLANRFGVEVSEIKKLNPSLFSRSLNTGETILIPQSAEKKNESRLKAAAVNSLPEPVETTGNSNCTPLLENIHQKYKVGLLLPFYLADVVKNDSLGIQKPNLDDSISFSTQVITNSIDTTVVLNGTNIDPRAEGFLDFYQGTLVAIDSLQRLGMNVELYVFDASSQEKINKLLESPEFFELNLIIGPVYPELQESVASFAAKNRIPMISPLSSSGNFEHNNSWFFKVNPTKDYQVEQTADYVAREFTDKNFFLLKTGENSESQEVRLASLCKAKLAKNAEKNLFHEFSFQNQKMEDILPILNENGENVFMIPSNNEAQVSVAVTNLTALAEHYDIVLMGTPLLPKLKSIQTENYHKLRLRYLSPYFIDYSRPVVRRFVGQYRNVFSAEPSQFSFQGFDVCFYFLSALYRYGKDFRNCLPDFPMELTQMNFNFEKVAPMGGFMNKSLFITSYERNFDVISMGSIAGF